VIFCVKRRLVAVLLLYFLSPLVVFEGAMTVHLSRGTLILPLLFFVVCSILCLLFYASGSFFWGRGNSLKNLAAFASANGNTGYFGIPVSLALFGEKTLGLVVLCSLGFLLYESSVGFLVLARGSFTLRESLRKLLRLPLLYAFAVGLAWNVLHLPSPNSLSTVLHLVRSVYSILGMMLVGLGLSGEGFSAVDGRLIGFTTAAKYAIWPVLMLAIISADRSFFHLFGADVHGVLLLMGMVPLAVNTVVYSSALRVFPEKAAVAVMVSTLVALFMIPALSVVFL
jgi:predicted permease